MTYFDKKAGARPSVAQVPADSTCHSFASGRSARIFFNIASAMGERHTLAVHTMSIAGIICLCMADGLLDQNSPSIYQKTILPRKC